MDLRQYLSANHPLVLKEYEMYERRDRIPAIGSIVATLGSFGFQEPNTRMKVVGYRSDNRIVLEDAWTSGYTISKENWYRQVYVVEEAQV